MNPATQALENRAGVFGDDVADGGHVRLRFVEHGAVVAGERFGGGIAAREVGCALRRVVHGGDLDVGQLRQHRCHFGGVPIGADEGDADLLGRRSVAGAACAAKAAGRPARRVRR